MIRDKNLGILSSLFLRIMIEFCTKKRMILAVAFMLGVSVLVLLIENNLPLGHTIKEIAQVLADGPDNATNKECWQETKHEVTMHCSPCSTFEMKALKICDSTGYREQLKCTYKNGTTKEVFRSCPKLSWMEQRNFWLFESVTLAVGAASYGVVCMRQKRLERMLLEKVHRQIAAGV